MNNEKTALLIIDIQNDYFPGGKMELVGSPEAAEKAAELLAAFRRSKLPVVHIQHISTRPGSTFFLPDTPGAEIHPSVAPNENETVFQKHYPNSFRETPLLEYLRSNNITNLVIAGMMTHMCIDATTRAAWDYGFKCTVVAPACATKDLTVLGHTTQAEQVHYSFLAALNGTYAQVENSILVD